MRIRPLTLAGSTLKKNNFGIQRDIKKMYINIINLRQEQGVGGGGMN